MGHVRNYTMGDVRRPLQARARASTCCTRWAGTPSACRPRTPRCERKASIPSDWTYDNIADDAGAAEAAWACRSTGAREFATCDPDYYGQQQALFLDLLEAGLVYRKEAEGQLGPGRHDRARQRAGDRRPRLALGRAGRAARADAVVLQDHRLSPTSCWTALDDARPLAGKGPADAGELDRPVARACGSRFELDATAPAGTTELEVFTTRPDTLFGASFVALVARSSAGAGAGRRRPEARRLHRRMPAQRHRAGGDRDGREAGLRHRPARRASVRSGWELPVYVANFVLMDYGTGAIFGCPAHDQRDLDFARKYGLPVIMPVVVPDGADPETFAIGDEAYAGDGRAGQFALPRRHDASTQAQDEAAIAGCEATAAAGERHGQLPPARLGRFAPALLGLPDPGHPLRRLRRRAGAGRRTCRCVLPDDVTFDKPGNPLDRHPTWKHVDLPALRQAGAARDRHAWTPSSIRPGTSRASPTRARDDADRSRASSTTGCRSTSISAASSTRSCTCSIPASSPARCTATGHVGMRRAVRRPVHAGHGDARDLSRRRTATGSTPAEVTIEGTARRPARHADGDRRAGRDRPHREDVEVEEERRRPRRHHRRPTAPTPRAGSCCRTRRPSATWTGPTPASRAPGASCSGCGGWSSEMPRATGTARAARRSGRSRDGAQGRPPRAARSDASSGCASTAPSPTSTNSPMRVEDAIGRRAPHRTRLGARARRSTSWCSCSRR